MSNDSYTEVTTTSFVQRIGNSIKGIITGLVLIVIGTGLLYWNEGRSVRQAGAIAEAELITVDMPNIDTIDPSFNGKVVYAKGEAKTKDIITDTITNVSTNAIKLDREVMYYQWVENKETSTTKKSDGSEEKKTTYTYTKEWTSSPIPSSSFKITDGHQNTSIFNLPLESEQFLAKDVSFGAYKLPEFIVGGIYNYELLNVQLTKEQIADLKSKLAIPVETIPVQQSVQTNTQYSQNAQEEKARENIDQQNQELQQAQQQNVQNQQMPQSAPLKYVHINANEIYLGVNQGNPNIGDVKIIYQQNKDTDISLIAKVNGNTFDRFVASNGNSFFKLSSKQESKEMLFQSAKDSNTMMTWILRALGVLLVIVGLKTVLAPLAIVADIIPLVGELVAMGTGLVATLVGLAWSFVIIGIAWIRFRPMLAFALICVALVVFAFTVWKGKSKKNEATAHENADHA